MIESIRLEQYQSTADCRTAWMSCRESFLKLSCEFRKGNVYGLVSDFGCGSWGLTACIGGRSNGSDEGRVLLNGRKISSGQLEKYAAFLPEAVIPEVNSPECLGSAKECIQKALAISGQDYTPEEIQSVFRLSDSRWERPLEWVSGEIWLISTAIQFALGKEIFCFPWLNMQHIFRFQVMCEEGITDFLRKKDKILLVPTSQKKIAKKLCDHMLIFGKTGIRIR